MKTKFLTLTFLIALAFGSFAQTKEELKTRTQQMINLSVAGDYATLLDFMYPKIFGVITKEDMLASMQKKMIGDGYNMGLVRTDPSIDYGAIERTDISLYCLITYTNVIKVALDEKINPKDEEATIARFKKILGVEEIDYNDKSAVLHTKKRVQVMAISDESSYGIWTFVPLDGSKYIDDVLQENMRKAIAEQ